MSLCCLSRLFSRKLACPHNIYLWLVAPVGRAKEMSQFLAYLVFRCSPTCWSHWTDVPNQPSCSRLEPEAKQSLWSSCLKASYILECLIGDSVALVVLGTVAQWDFILSAHTIDFARYSEWNDYTNYTLHTSYWQINKLLATWQPIFGSPRQQFSLPSQADTGGVDCIPQISRLYRIQCIHFHAWINYRFCSLYDIYKILSWCDYSIHDSSHSSPLKGEAESLQRVEQHEARLLMGGLKETHISSCPCQMQCLHWFLHIWVLVEERPISGFVGTKHPKNIPSSSTCLQNLHCAFRFVPLPW